MSKPNKFLSRVRDISQPPIVIAEVADAHYGSMDHAISMIERAKASGADVVKFQHHIPSEEMLPATPMSSNMSEPLWDFLMRNALTIDQHEELARYSKNVGITYACTPFSWAAAKELENAIKPDFYKIGSGEMLDFPTLERIASFGRPMVVSTGMSTIEEVDEAYAFLQPISEGLVLMSCTSAYPPSATDVHLSFLSEMIERYPGASIGFSDHSPGIHFPLAAVALGARIVEKHVTLDEDLRGPDSDVSIGFDQLSALVDQIREISIARNVRKSIQPGEEEIRLWAQRSLVYLGSFGPGHKISEDDVWSKRPGFGVPARHRGIVIGRTLAKSVQENTLVDLNDFEP